MVVTEEITSKIAKEQGMTTTDVIEEDRRSNYWGIRTVRLSEPHFSACASIV